MKTLSNALILLWPALSLRIHPRRRPAPAPSLIIIVITASSAAALASTQRTEAGAGEGAGGAVTMNVKWQSDGGRQWAASERDS